MEAVAVVAAMAALGYYFVSDTYSARDRAVVSTIPPDDIKVTVDTVKKDQQRRADVKYPQNMRGRWGTEDTLGRTKTILPPPNKAGPNPAVRKYDKNISPLTGLPYDPVHSNMTPFYKGAGINNPTQYAQYKMELFSGTLNDGSPAEAGREEQVNAINPGDTLRRDQLMAPRRMPFLKPDNYATNMTPVQTANQKIPELEARFMPPTIDQTRTLNNPATIYDTSSYNSLGQVARTLPEADWKKKDQGLQVYVPPVPIMPGPAVNVAPVPPSDNNTQYVTRFQNDGSWATDYQGPSVAAAGFMRGPVDGSYDICKEPVQADYYPIPVTSVSSLPSQNTDYTRIVNNTIQGVWSQAGAKASTEAGYVDGSFFLPARASDQYGAIQQTAQSAFNKVPTMPYLPNPNMPQTRKELNTETRYVGSSMPQVPTMAPQNFMPSDKLQLPTPAPIQGKNPITTSEQVPLQFQLKPEDLEMLVASSVGYGAPAAAVNASTMLPMNVKQVTKDVYENVSNTGGVSSLVNATTMLPMNVKQVNKETYEAAPAAGPSAVVSASEYRDFQTTRNPDFTVEGRTEGGKTVIDRPMQMGILTATPELTVGGQMNAGKRWVTFANTEPGLVQQGDKSFELPTPMPTRTAQLQDVSKPTRIFNEMDAIPNTTVEGRANASHAIQN